MNSLVCIIGYFVLILTINVGAKYNLRTNNHGNNLQYADTRVEVAYPFYFGYLSGQSLNMRIFFKNIPSNVDATLSYTRGLDLKQSKTSVLVSGVLNYEHISVDLKLKTGFGFCTKIRIAEGINLSVPSTRSDSNKFKYDTSCVNPVKPCTIVVDLKNEFEGYPTLIQTNCYRNLNKFVCTLQMDQEGDIIQTWYHDYGKQNSVIGSIRNLQARKTKLIMTLEKFDNNTEIYNILTATRIYKTLMSKRWKIYVFANESREYSNVATLKYGLTKKVLFDCRNYLNITKNIQIGFINTENKISTDDQKWVERNFNISDNGTILCCLVHIIHVGYKEQQLERFVEKKTQLIYDESLDLVPSESKKNDALSGFKNSIFYSIIATAVIIVVLLVIIIIIVYVKKRYRKNPNTEEPLELNTYTSPNRVTYANLDFDDDDDQKTKPDEECTYAVIIGELNPF